MSVVIPFGRFFHRASVPPLLFVEMFEYQLDARRIERFRPALDNCRMLLEHARSRGLPVGYTISRSRTYRRDGTGLGWIGGFQPRRGDMVFETVADSCYSSTEFAEAISSAGGCFLLAGFSGERVCLATLLDAAVNCQSAGLIGDATVVRELPGLDPAESHRALVGVAGAHAPVLTTNEWIQSRTTRHTHLESSYDRG